MQYDESILYNNFEVWDNLITRHRINIVSIVINE